MKTSSGSMEKFEIAMNYVYQYLDSDPESWIPPPVVGNLPGRYLWTDSFAIVNFITLYKETSREFYLTLARRLILRVHETLGRTVDGRERLPGASDSWPLLGGLRAGKIDEEGEDAQFHHLNTIYLFALNRMSVATGDKWYHDQAVSMAKAIHPKFVYDREGERPGIFWKMETDLKNVVDDSEGNLDPMDGYIVFRLLQKADGPDSQVLADEIRDYKKMVDDKWRDYASGDPLDLGMTLWKVHWHEGDEKWADEIADAARADLAELLDQSLAFEKPLRRRLAFREFGACFGIACNRAGPKWEARRQTILRAWAGYSVIPDSGGDKGEGDSTMDQLLPVTLMMYAAALFPGAFQRGYLPESEFGTKSAHPRSESRG